MNITRAKITSFCVLERQDLPKGEKFMIYVCHNVTCILLFFCCEWHYYKKTCAIDIDPKNYRVSGFSTTLYRFITHYNY